jgi:hypothetical protein
MQDVGVIASTGCDAATGQRIGNLFPSPWHFQAAWQVVKTAQAAGRA